MFPHKDITDDLSRAKKFFENIVSYTIGPFSLDKVISKKIDTKKAPDLKFKYDESLEYGKRIEELLKQTK